MLSIENPPPDPPYQHLKITIKDHETSSQNLPLPEEEEDLSNDAVLDHSAFPNFSLRDYVFSARSKDIQNNWPFSLKNLQLCLKHGVKDLLPPFQSPDCVRNQQLVECGGGGRSTSEFQNTSVVHGKVSEPQEHVQQDTSDLKIDEKQVNACRREGENGLAPTMTSNLQPQKKLVSTSGPSSSFLKTDNLLDTPIEVDNTTGFPASEKDEIKINTSSKKCKIIRKSTNHVDQSTTAADIVMSFSGVSETMASKVCPVCKMFSSSSNTTLNAHIDQCLSMASTPKSISDSKLTRYRIKPRKTKLMVDIYATARTCTLEELDRRNGTSWATLSCLPAQDIENSQTNINGGKKQKVVPVHPEDIDNSAGAVYIDANGTKVRILSKFSSSSPLPKVQDDLGSRKLRGVKERKFHSVKKKKCKASKHHKYFKVAAQGRKVSAQKCISQVQEGHAQRKGSNSLEVHKITKQAKPHHSGTLRQWACSKRTRASKSTRKEGYQPSSFKWHVDTDRSVLADSYFERSQVQDQTNSSEHCVSSPESSDKTDNTEYEVHISDTSGWSPVRRILRSSFSGEKIDSGSLAQTKKITSHLRKGSSFRGNNDLVKPRNTTGKIIKFNQPSEMTPGSNKLSMNYHENALKARKLNSSRRKDVLVSSRSSTGSKSPQFNRFSTDKKPGNHFGSHEVGMFASWHSTFYHSHSSSDGSTETESDQSAKEDVTEVVSSEVSRELKNRSNREAMSKVIASSSSDSEPEYYGRHEEENMDSDVRMHAEFQEESKGFELGSKENSFYEDVSVDSSSKLALKESFMCFCKSMDLPFQKMNNIAKNRCDVLQSTPNCPCAFYGLDGAKGGFSESSFGHGQEMFFTDEDCNAMIGHDVQRDLDSEVGRGSSSFVVDPISIPGPPGSFLPSPSRDMRSEEYRGNSSLSNSCVHSCQDQHDLIDGDSSGSPISATSTISNSTAFRSCLKHNNNDSSGVYSDLFRDKLGSVSQNAGALPLVENDVGLPHEACTRDAKINGGGMFTVNKLSVERRTLGIVNDGQPCHCQRVDRAYQDINVNYQEPQLARHQSSTLETMPAIDRKQITYSPNVRRNSLDIMPEEPALSHSRHALYENMRIPIDKSPSKSHSVDGFSDLVPKFSMNNCEPASPVTSNSVLRLMGKNLMVVNKEEVDVAKPANHPQPHPQLNHVSSQVPSFAGDSLENVRSQASCSFPRWSHQDSLENQNAGNTLGQSLDLRLSKGFRKPANLNMPSSHVREPAALFLKQQTNGGHTASRAYKSNYTNEALNRHDRTQNEAAMYNTSRTLKMSDHHQQMNPHSTTNDPNYPGGMTMMRTTLQIIAPGVSIPFPSSGNPLHVNAFCCYQPKDAASNLDKPASLHNSSFQSPPSQKDHTSPVKWDCNSESPYVCRRGVF